MMKNWKKWICAGLLGTSILMAGCGQQAAVSHQAPLVKTVVAGESMKGEKTTFSGTTDKTTGEEYAVAQVSVKHENANLVYTLSFDKDLALVGLYLK